MLLKLETMTSTEEMNAVIAKFCGFPTTKGMVPHFHTGWNWLMYAVRRIVELSIENGSTGDGELFMSNEYTSVLDTVPLAVIEDAHKVVYEFVVFYNTLNK